MKKLFIIIVFALFTTTAGAQELLTFTDVVNVDSVSKADLYNRAKLWLNDTYLKAENVINLDDKENGVIIVKANIFFIPKKNNDKGATGIISYTFKLYIKDYKYKYEISNFFHTSTNIGAAYSFETLYKNKLPIVSPSIFKSWNNKVYAEIKEYVAISIEDLILSLNKAMSSKSDIENDW